MPLPYTRPGVAVAVVGTPAAQAPGATGGITALIGTAPKGYGGANPIIYTSLADFIRDYGDPSLYPYPQWTLPLAAQLYFSQSGVGSGLRPGLIVERIGTVASTITLAGLTGSLPVTAQPAYTGTAGNAITVTVTAGSGTTQNISMSDGQGRVENYTIVDATSGAQAASILASLLGSSAIVAPGTAVNGAWFTAGTFTLATGADGQGTAIAQAHFDALANIVCEFVVPLDGVQGTALLAQAHANSMSNSYSKARVAVVGPAQGATVAQMTTNAVALADAGGRVVYFGHDAIKVVNPAVAGSLQVVPGFFGAPCVAGAKAANAVYEPLTGKGIYGIAGPNTILTPSQLDSLAQNGCTVLDTGYGGLIVRDSVTTAQGTFATSYTKLVNRVAEDEFANRIRQWAQTQFIGRPNDRDAAGRIQSGVAGVGAMAIRDRVIAGIGAVTPSPITNGWTCGVQYAQSGEIDYMNFNLTVTQ